MRLPSTFLLLALLLGACAAPGPAVQSGESRIPIEILKPEGAGPFPAVVMLHDCSGLGPISSGSPGRWAQRLVQRGYVVAMPDSFSPRGYPNGVCADGTRVSLTVRDPDVYATLQHLRTLGYVDGKRIGVMGGSHGGATALLAMRTTGARAVPATDRSAGFAAGIALYPGCPEMLARGYRAVGPVLILAAELDDWTPAAPCVALAEVAAKAGDPIAIKVYPGAHHSFDNDRPVRRVPHALGGKGATIGGNPQAWMDAIEQVEAFFARHLKQAR